MVERADSGNSPRGGGSRSEVRESAERPQPQTERLQPAAKEQVPGTEVRSNNPKSVAQREDALFGGKGFSFDQAPSPYDGGTKKGASSEAEKGTAESDKKPAESDKKPGDSDKKPGDSDKKPGDSDKKPGDDKKPDDAKKDPFTVLNDPNKLDPNKPTVAFLDDFKTDWPAVSMNGLGNGLSHGEFSARGAEGNGFNAVRLQSNNQYDQQGNNDFSKQINGVSDAIESGKLKLGKGDVLNISQGQNVDKTVPGSGDPTFEQASKTLGMNITKDNLQEMRPQILQRAKELANDPSQTEETRKSMQRVVDTNEAIDRLQAKGVEVVHAAGNDGPDRFSMDFMNAKHQLSGVQSDGSPAPESSRNSLTTDSNFSTPVRYQQADMLNPKPIAEQQGTYSLGQSGAKLSAEDFGGTRTGKDFWREEGPGHFVINDPKPNSVPPEALSPTPMGPPQQFEKVAPNPNEKVTDSPVRKASMSFKPPDINDDEKANGRIVAVPSGTSFGNIDYLKTQYDRLQGLHNGR